MRVGKRVLAQEAVADTVEVQVHRRVGEPGQRLQPIVEPVTHIPGHHAPGSVFRRQAPHRRDVRAAETGLALLLRPVDEDQPSGRPIPHGRFGDRHDERYEPVCLVDKLAHVQPSVLGVDQTGTTFSAAGFDGFRRTRGGIVRRILCRGGFHHAAEEQSRNQGQCPLPSCRGSLRKEHGTPRSGESR